MLSGVLGVVAFVLVIFVIGAIMEENGKGVLKYGAALAVCVVAILTLTKPLPYSSGTNCFIDWDGRANAEVCD